MKQDEDEKLESMNKQNKEEMQHANDQIKVQIFMAISKIFQQTQRSKIYTCVCQVM